MISFTLNIEFTLNDGPINFILNVEIEGDEPVVPVDGIFDESFDFTFE